MRRDGPEGDRPGGRLSYLSWKYMTVFQPIHVYRS